MRAIAPFDPAAMARRHARTAVKRPETKTGSDIEADKRFRTFLTSKALIRVVSVGILGRFRKKITVAKTILTGFQEFRLRGHPRDLMG
jgi:hypothetical protein